MPTSYTWTVNVPTAAELGAGNLFGATNPAALLPRDIAMDLSTKKLVRPLRLNFGVEAVAQSIMIRCGTWLGEWFLDKSRGIPYRESIFVKDADPASIRAIFRAQILGTVGVTATPEVNADIDTSQRHLSVTAKAESDYGEIETSLGVTAG